VDGWAEGRCAGWLINRHTWPPLTPGHLRELVSFVPNAVTAIPADLQEWEFHTVIGGDRSQVTALLGKIHDEIGVLRRADPES